jgi:DNA-3-methyladenine glycosylase II
MLMVRLLDHVSLDSACRALAEQDGHLADVYRTYGAPPLWDRPQGFATLLHIILEQQVSLASARACMDRLQARVGSVTPKAVLGLNDEELKTVGFSRQKIRYARLLAVDVITGKLSFDKLHKLDDDTVRTELMKHTGIGRWTADIYLIMALLRTDVLPYGDIALHAAYHELTGEPRPNSEEFSVIGNQWRPYRSVAARLLWHSYLSRRGRA